MSVNGIFCHIIKDLKIDSRKSSGPVQLIVFPAIAAFFFALFSGIQTPDTVASIIWVLSFVGITGSTMHSYQREKERGNLTFLITIANPEEIFIAKLIVNFIYSLAIVFIISFVYFFVRGFFPKNALFFIFSQLLGASSLVSVMTIISFLSVKSNGGQFFIGILSFPVVSPALFVSAGSLSKSISGFEFYFYDTMFLIAFSVFNGTLSLILHRKIWNDNG